MKWVAAACAVAALSLLVAGMTSRSSATQLKIGVPLALTGPIAAQAQEMVRGYQLYLKRHGGKLGGVPVKLYFEDTHADPAIVIAKTRKLISSDRVHFIGGAALALVGLVTVHESSTDLPESRQFVSDWKKAYGGQIPSSWGRVDLHGGALHRHRDHPHRTKTGMKDFRVGATELVADHTPRYKACTSGEFDSSSGRPSNTMAPLFIT